MIETTVTVAWFWCSDCARPVTRRMGVLVDVEPLGACGSDQLDHDVEHECDGI